LLTSATILEQALHIADREGLNALTLRRVAEECSVTAMALYAHFDNKRALVAALSALVLDGVRLPDLTNARWQEQLADTIRVAATTLHRHPALIPTINSAMLRSSGGLAIAERVLTLLDRAGLDAQAAGTASRQLLASVAAIVSNTVANGDQQPLAELTADLSHAYPHVAASFDTLAACGNWTSDLDSAISRLVLGLGASHS
jgi:AcrR family transcriptional regulator